MPRRGPYKTKRNAADDQVMMYDITTDSMRPVTQADWDGVQEAFRQYGMKREMLSLPEEDPSKPWKFQLAMFPNPMRPGEAYIAEAKAIDPEPLVEYHGRPLYATVPETQWIIRGSINLDFACEIVRRWNRPHGSI